MTTRHMLRPDKVLANGTVLVVMLSGTSVASPATIGAVVASSFKDTSMRFEGESNESSNGSSISCAQDNVRNAPKTFRVATHIVEIFWLRDVNEVKMLLPALCQQRCGAVRCGDLFNYLPKAKLKKPLKKDSKLS